MLLLFACAKKNRKGRKEPQRAQRNIPLFVRAYAFSDIEKSIGENHELQLAKTLCVFFALLRVLCVTKNSGRV